MKAVRLALKAAKFSEFPGDTLWRALKHLAGAGDAFRHLTLGRIDAMIRKLEQMESCSADIAEDELEVLEDFRNAGDEGGHVAPTSEDDEGGDEAAVSDSHLWRHEGAEGL